MSNFSIGVDLGGTNLRIAAVNEQGDLMEKVTLGTRVALGKDHVIHEMCDAIRALTAKYRDAGLLQGIGVGVPGIIDLKTGMLREAPNLPGWSESPVLTLGTGVGGGIVLEGRIWHGMTGMAGEFGHMTVEPEGPQCGCGNRGCVEQYASATAVVRMAKEAIASGRAPALAIAADSDAEFNARAVYNLAIQGDEEARKIFGRVGRALGICIANLVNAFNLPMYVVGGGVASAWEAFSPFIFEELRQRSLIYAATAPRSPLSDGEGASGQVESEGPARTIITRALLGSDAGLYGAAQLPMTRTS